MYRQNIAETLRSVIEVGQEHVEVSKLRWLPIVGIFSTHWNVSMSAKVKTDYQQRWRYFGVTVLGGQFGFVVKLP